MGKRTATEMFDIFKSKPRKVQRAYRAISYSDLGEKIAQDTLTDLVSLKEERRTAPDNFGIDPAIIIRELALLKCFVIERVVNRLFEEPINQQKILNSCIRHLVVSPHGILPPDSFQKEYDVRWKVYSDAWNEPMDRTAGRSVAIEIAGLCGSRFHAGLMIYIEVLLAHWYCGLMESVKHYKDEFIIHE